MALLEELVRQNEPRPSKDRAYRPARVFQHVEMPAIVLCIGDWDSSEAFSATVSERRGKAAPDPVHAQETEVHVFRRLSVYDIAWRPTVVSCTLVVAPARARTLVRALSEEVLEPAVSGLPGFVVGYCYQGRDNPDYYLTVRGWDSPAALERFLRDMAPRVTASLRGLGATVDHYVERTRADLLAPAGTTGRPHATSERGVAWI